MPITPVRSRKKSSRTCITKQIQMQVMKVSEDTFETGEQRSFLIQLHWNTAHTRVSPHIMRRYRSTQKAKSYRHGSSKLLMIVNGMNFLKQSIRMLNRSESNQRQETVSVCWKSHCTICICRYPTTGRASRNYSVLSNARSGRRSTSLSDRICFITMICAEERLPGGR